MLHAKLVKAELNSVHDLNVADLVDRYHGVHDLSILAYVLSVGFELLYVVPFHHFNLLHPWNILLELVTLLVVHLLDAYIAVKLLEL